MPTPPRWLSTLIQIRRRLRDDCRRKLNDAVRAGDLLEDKSASVQGQVAELAEARRRASAQADFDVNRLLAAQRHQAALDIEQQSIAEQIELVRQEADKRRNSAVAAEQQVRMLEKLSERKARDAQSLADRREAKRLDEVATILRGTGRYL